MRNTMTSQSILRGWPADELRKITEAGYVHIAPFRKDGVTYGIPTRVWSVVVDGEIYVRSYTGQKSRWYQAAMRERAGRIIAAEMIADIRFEPVLGPINDRIDSAYRAKYRGSPYLNAMIGEKVRGATVRITPRNRG
jgi:hypothetical protein